MSNSTAPAWVGAAVSGLLLMGGAVAAYVDVKSDIAVVETKLDEAKESKKELDDYDAILQRQVDDNRRGLIKTEAKQESIAKNQERFERTMEEMLKEMKKLNENVLLLGAKEK